LPIFMSVALTVLNPNYMKILFEDPSGPMILIVAGTMQLIGSMMLWKIIHIEV